MGLTVFFIATLLGFLAPAPGARSSLRRLGHSRIDKAGTFFPRRPGLGSRKKSMGSGAGIPSDTNATRVTLCQASVGTQSALLIPLGGWKMKLTVTCGAAAVLFFTFSAFGQEGPQRRGGVPIYNVTVVERTTKAVNYQYRSGPTMIDLRGTVLMTAAKGEATVESKRGRTEIDVKVDNLAPATQFGREYLTYTLWAITPEGAPHNIGELIPNGSNKARMHVTTDLQAFGMIVTAEPHSAARQPSDVVVLENEVRPDTIGTVKEIEAKYELMPRGQDRKSTR